MLPLAALVLSSLLTTPITPSFFAAGGGRLLKTELGIFTTPSVATSGLQA